MGKGDCFGFCKPEDAWDERMYVGTKNALVDRPAIEYPKWHSSKSDTQMWWKTNQTDWILQQGEWSGAPPEDLEKSLFSQERLISGVSVCIWKQPKLLAVPTIIYIPGHAFGTEGSFNDQVYKNYLVRLAALGKCIVVAVDPSPIGYFSFTLAVNEIASVAQAVANGDVARVRKGPVVLAGNSTGGTLALATAIKANKEGWVDKICGIYSICPFVEAVASSNNYPSMKKFDGYAIWEGYLQACVNMVKAEQRGNGRMFPMRASYNELKGLPPTKIVVYELDMLRDMGLAMHQKLLNAGVLASVGIVRGVHDQQLYTLHSPDVTSFSIGDLAEFSNYVAAAAGVDFKSSQADSEG